MEDKKFIREKLEELVVRFPQVNVRYEHDTMARVHVIEVTPQETHHLDEAYISWEMSMHDEFISRFQSHGLCCFTSDDDVVGIRNAEYSLMGSDFVPAPSSATVGTNPIAIPMGGIHAVTKAGAVSFQQDHQMKLDYDEPALHTYKLAA